MDKYDIQAIVAVSVICLLVGVLIAAGNGIFAFDDGVIIEVEGVQLQYSQEAYGHVYVVKQIRRFGPDRVIGAFPNAGQAIQFWLIVTGKAPIPFGMFQPANPGGNG